MKTKVLAAVCAVAISCCNVTSCLADTAPDPGAVVVDVVVARPLCLAVTVFGAAFFIVSLPVTTIAKSVKSTGRSLVVKPAKATFTRPVGDLDALMD
jgi:hypothetical protein